MAKRDREYGGAIPEVYLEFVDVLSNAKHGYSCHIVPLTM